MIHSKIGGDLVKACYRFEANQTTRGYTKSENLKVVQHAGHTKR